MAEQENNIPDVEAGEGNFDIEPPRPLLTRNKWLTGLIVLAFVAFLFAIVGLIAYRFGYVDEYIKTQFTARMSEMGIAFEAKTFAVRLPSIELELADAKFRDKLTNEELFSIDNAQLDLSVQNLFGWQTNRDITVEKTIITGAHVWVKFDENGRSNFSNLKLIEDEKGSSVNFKYDTGSLEIKDSTVHFGDVVRKISADAREIRFLLFPEGGVADAGAKKYGFSLNSEKSSFTYDQRTVDDISINATGIADDKGAEFTRFDLKTPIGYSYLTGRLTDWASPKYAFDIESSVDLVRAGDIFSPGSALAGQTSFIGKVTGEGESYTVSGNARSNSLRAGDVLLKALDVEATVSGTNSNYTANGTAFAQMLTFDDFRVDMIRMMGNVRGTGTDFRWLGDLQAAAARTPSLTLGGLFLRDARLEHRDRAIIAESGSGRAQKFSIDDTEFAELQARNLKFSLNDGRMTISAPSANALSYRSPDFRLDGISGKNVAVRNAAGVTTVDLDGVRSQKAEIRGKRAAGVSAEKFSLRSSGGRTAITAKNLRSDDLDLDAAQIKGLESPDVVLNNDAAGLVVYSDRLRVASVDSEIATLGSLNIGGFRLSVKRGRVTAASGDVDAGRIAVKPSDTFPDGGTLEDAKFGDPIYILEPSGRYRATADMSIGGGTLGSVSLGNAAAKVDVNNDRADINEIDARLMKGTFRGNARIALTEAVRSGVKGDFSDLDLGGVLSVYFGRIVPVEGRTTGKIDMNFETALRQPTGELQAKVEASAGSSERGFIPVNGELDIGAVNGSFDVRRANFKTVSTEFDAKGRAEFTWIFDAIAGKRGGNSDLAVSVHSTDAAEVERLIRVTGAYPDLTEQIDRRKVEVAGNFDFDGRFTGDLSSPDITGKASLASISLQGTELGSIRTDVVSSGDVLTFDNGRLTEHNGSGYADFNIRIPFSVPNATEVSAVLKGVDAGSLLSAFPAALPERIRDLDGRANGTIDVRGLPNNAVGRVDVSVANGVINSQPFDGLDVSLGFADSELTIDKAEMTVGTGRLSANGKYNWADSRFDLTFDGKAVPAPVLLALLPRNDSIPAITGDLDLNAHASGNASNAETYEVRFSGMAPNVLVGDTSVGSLSFSGRTENKQLVAELTAMLEGRPQVVSATVDFGKDEMPFTVETNFDQSSVAPFLAFVPQLKGMAITGRGTGRIEFNGNFTKIVGKDRVFGVDKLSGTAAFSELALQIQDTPLSAAEPIVIKFSPSEAVFERARFAGGGSNMSISGKKALTDEGTNDLRIEGRVNLNLLNLFTRDTFFAGFADTQIFLNGPNKTAHITGRADFVNASVATFIGSDRFTLERIKARAIFNANQIEVQEATGFLGGGRFTANGGGYLDGLSISSFRLALNGTGVTLPLPKDFMTTGDAQLEITGIRESKSANLQLTLAGRVYARRSVYSKDIDLANVVGARRDVVLSGGGSTINPPRFDLTIEGRDALIVKNNIADLTASVSLVLTGDANEPRLSGRIAANSGTIFFRKDRYEVQRGVLEFPPDTAIEPVIDLQAESEIAGYQVFVNLSGPLKDSEQLTATVRSSPALPQADVVSLITTGSLANTAGGIPTLAQTGINTAAEILTDTIINNPARKATDKLFGLNVFEIDPIISGQQLNPSARLTVGRQINNNLRVTYSTNLSQDQNQVLAFEYRVSNKLSFVAQYEQRSLSNVTRNRDNFSFEVRFRKRF